MRHGDDSAGFGLVCLEIDSLVDCAMNSEKIEDYLLPLAYVCHLRESNRQLSRVQVTKPIFEHLVSLKRAQGIKDGAALICLLYTV